jgi:hypothetical protein
VMAGMGSDGAPSSNAPPIPRTTPAATTAPPTLACRWLKVVRLMCGAARREHIARRVAAKRTAQVALGIAAAGRVRSSMVVRLDCGLPTHRSSAACGDLNESPTTYLRASYYRCLDEFVSAPVGTCDALRCLSGGARTNAAPNYFVT